MKFLKFIVNYWMPLIGKHLSGIPLFQTLCRTPARMPVVEGTFWASSLAEHNSHDELSPENRQRKDVRRCTSDWWSAPSPALAAAVGLTT